MVAITVLLFIQLKCGNVHSLLKGKGINKSGQRRPFVVNRKGQIQSDIISKPQNGTLQVDAIAVLQSEGHSDPQVAITYISLRKGL